MTGITHFHDSFEIEAESPELFLLLTFQGHALCFRRQLVVVQGQPLPVPCRGPQGRPLPAPYRGPQGRPVLSISMRTQFCMKDNHVSVNVTFLLRCKGRVILFA